MGVRLQQCTRRDGGQVREYITRCVFNFSHGSTTLHEDNPVPVDEREAAEMDAMYYSLRSEPDEMVWQRRFLRRHDFCW